MTDTVPVTQADRKLFAELGQALMYGWDHNDESACLPIIARHRRAAEQSRASTPAVDREEAEAVAERVYRSYPFPRDDDISPSVMVDFAARAILALHPPVMGEVEAENARLREVIRKNAVRFEHCADLIADSFNVSGTLRAERTIKARHFAAEALATLSTEQVR